MSCAIVLLPAPLGPTSATTSPAEIRKLTASRTRGACESPEASSGSSWYANVTPRNSRSPRNGGGLPAPGRERTGRGGAGAPAAPPPPARGLPADSPRLPRLALGRGHLSSGQV